MPEKKKKLSEKKIDKLYVIAKGFNVPDPDRLEGYRFAGEEGAELRFDPGTEEHPNFVEEKDFLPEDWEALTESRAVVLFEKPDELRPDESVAAEIIEE